MARKQPTFRYFLTAFAATVLLLMLLFIPALIRIGGVDPTSNTAEGIPYNAGAGGGLTVEYTKSKGDCLNMAVAVTEGEEERMSLVYVLRFDPYNDRITLLSLPVDTFVMDQGETHTLTQRYSSGGIQGLSAGIESLLNTSIDRTARITQQNFEAVLNYVGSLEYTIPYALIHEDTVQKTYVHIPGGEQTLDGRRIYSLLTFPFEEEGKVHRSKVQADVMAQLINQRLDWRFSLRLEEAFTFSVNMAKTDLSYNDYTYYKTPFEYLLSLEEDIGKAVFLDGEAGSLGFTPAKDSLEKVREYFAK